MFLQVFVSSLSGDFLLFYSKDVLKFSTTLNQKVLYRIWRFLCFFVLYCKIPVDQMLKCVPCYTWSLHPCWTWSSFTSFLKFLKLLAQRWSDVAKKSHLYVRESILPFPLPEKGVTKTGNRKLLMFPVFLPAMWINDLMKFKAAILWEFSGNVWVEIYI